jgi:RNA polymerase sigma-70 factor (ECF subfamily)
MAKTQANSASDRDLVAAAIAADRQAFAVLVERYAVSVKTVAISIVRDHHAAEDIAQETFVQGYKRLSSLRIPSLFGRWILKIARHLALRSLRAVRNDVSLDNAAEIASAEPNHMDTDQLLTELMRLPEREQRLLMLRYFSGHSIEEIARITGRPVGTVTKQMSRGYARLRERLAEVMV